MKLLTILALALVVTACGKKASFDGRSNPTDPVGNEPVTLDAQYKSTVNMTADISYSAKVRVGGNESNLPVVNEGFKIPQELVVTQGWASLGSSAKVTISATGLTSIVCTYVSQATVSHNNSSNSSQEYTRGLSYKFSNCSDTSVDPTVVVDGYDRVTLTVVKADDLETKTVVSGDIKLYQ